MRVNSLLLSCESQGSRSIDKLDDKHLYLLIHLAKPSVQESHNYIFDNIHGLVCHVIEYVPRSQG